MTEEMIKIWQEEIGDLGISSLSKGFLKRLQNSLKNFFECSLESWKVYCQMIASSKFLMGEAQNKFFKKAWITWAIKEEAIKRIKGGDFNLGDRKTNEDKKIEEISNEIKNLENKKKEVEQTIKYIKNSLKNERIKKVKEKKTFLSKGEIDNFKLEFIKFLETENNSITEEFRKFGWNGIFVDSYFESFVKDQIMIVLFSNTLTDEIDKSIKKCGLLEVLKKIDNEICLVQHKKNILMTKNFEKLL